MQERCDLERVGRFHVNEMFVPRLAGVLQGLVNVFLDPLSQVIDLRVGDPIRELAQIPLQLSIHQLETTDQKFRVVIGRADTKS